MSEPIMNCPNCGKKLVYGAALIWCPDERGCGWASANPDGTLCKSTATNEKFPTGSQRDSRKGKGRFDLLPPFAMQQLALHCEEGANKYGERNWEKGQPLGRYLDSAKRHLNDMERGLTNEDHLRAALWNIACMIDTRERIKAKLLPESLNDMAQLPTKNVPEK